MRRAAAVWLLAFASAFALAADVSPPAPADPALEQRVSSVAAGLRCLVCQNQTIADSNAPLATDLKDQIREQLQAGRSEREISDYMVARYGDFVLYKPPWNASTVLLWVGPFLLFVAGAVALGVNLNRRRREQGAVPPLTDAQRARARAMLADSEPRE